MKLTSNILPNKIPCIEDIIIIIIINTINTVEILQFNKGRYGQEILDTSAKHTLCQLTFRQCLKNSINNDIRNLYSLTSQKSDMQYDSFQTIKAALKKIHEEKTAKIESLKVQGAVIKEIWKTALPKAKDSWFKAQHRLPKNNYSFNIRYMNDSLACISNLSRWGVNVSANCTFCREIQTIKHVISGCFSCLSRYTWRHDSVLFNLANFLQPIAKKLYCDIPIFHPVGLITGTALRPELIFVDRENNIFIIELTVGHESTIKSNAARKATKYKHLLRDKEMTGAYSNVKIVNLVMTSIGVYPAQAEVFFAMLKSLGVDSPATKYITFKFNEICIRSSYYIFHIRAKEWSEPELIQF